MLAQRASKLLRARLPKLHAGTWTLTGYAAHFARCTKRGSYQATRLRRARLV